MWIASAWQWGEASVGSGYEFLRLGAVSSCVCTACLVLLPWLVSVRGLLVEVVVMRVVKRAFLTRLSCHSVLTVGCPVTSAATR